MAGFIAEQGPVPAWVTTHTEPIIKALLNIPAKFWWAIVQSNIQLTLANNALTLERAILVTYIAAGYDIDWACLKADQVHDAALKRLTSTPFLRLIYRLCLEFRVEILH